MTHTCCILTSNGAIAAGISLVALGSITEVYTAVAGVVRIRCVWRGGSCMRPSTPVIDCALSGQHCENSVAYY